MQITVTQLVGLVLTISLGTLGITACSSFQTDATTSTQTSISELTVGDTVEVVTADAEKLRFTIEEIEDDALIGNDVRVAKKDIRIVSVKRIDSQKTAFAITETGYIVITVLMIAALAVLAP